MIKIDFKSEVWDVNLSERTCCIILYGVARQDNQEVGKFFIDKKILQAADYDSYFNQATLQVDENFLKAWEESATKDLKELTNQLEKLSNSEVKDKK
ncbi:MAG TPA: hypothetical protein VNB90_15035 [Cytophagaceae bacterium]|nr:hypothetical protein [Cytophagaceae bacterium]